MSEEKLFLTAADLVRIGYLRSETSAADTVKRGELPLPTRVGQRLVWRRDEVFAHFEERKGVTTFANGLSSNRRIVRRSK